MWIRTVDCPLVYCIFSCAGIILNRCAIVLSNIAWKIGILHHCLVIVAFPCKLIFEISNMCLTNALLIGMLQEATYLWEDDDDRLVALFYDLMLASVQFNSWYCCSFQNLLIWTDETLYSNPPSQFLNLGLIWTGETLYLNRNTKGRKH